MKYRSQKTNTYCNIKLPKYAVDIFERYRSESFEQTILGEMALSNFNTRLKTIGEKSNFTREINPSREKLGNAQNLYESRVRFCDKISSHMMRRTTITTLLILRIPEHLVRNISGHSKGSNSFDRYVNYAQGYIDEEFDKVHDKLQRY